MIIINRTSNDWCQRCQYVDFYDWYICDNKKVDPKLFDENGFIRDKDTWKKCNCFKNSNLYASI